MSIYCTAFVLDPSFCDPEDEHLGFPFVYRGSHVEPAPDHPRGGSLCTGIIPPHIGGHCRDFLRLMAVEAEDAPDRDPGCATVLLDRAQVKALRDHLSAWLAGEYHEDGETR